VHSTGGRPAQPHDTGAPGRCQQPSADRRGANRTEIAYRQASADRCWSCCAALRCHQGACGVSRARERRSRRGTSSAVSRFIACAETLHDLGAQVSAPCHGAASRCVAKTGRTVTGHNGGWVVPGQSSEALIACQVLRVLTGLMTNPADWLILEVPQAQQPQKLSMGSCSPPRPILPSRGMPQPASPLHPTSHFAADRVLRRFNTPSGHAVFAQRCWEARLPTPVGAHPVQVDLCLQCFAVVNGTQSTATVREQRRQGVHAVPRSCHFVQVKLEVTPPLRA